MTSWPFKKNAVGKHPLSLDWAKWDFQCFNAINGDLGHLGASHVKSSIQLFLTPMFSKDYYIMLVIL